MIKECFKFTDYCSPSELKKLAFILKFIDKCKKKNPKDWI